MKKIIAFLCAVAMICTQMVSFAQIPFTSTVKNPYLDFPIDPSSKPVGGTLIVEGEDMTDYDENVVAVKAVSGASQGKVLNISAPSNNMQVNGVINVPNYDIRYVANISEPGTYNLWIRTQIDDSIYYAINSDTYTSTSISVNYKDQDLADPSFGWRKLHTAYYPANSTIDFKLAHRYKDIYLDKLIITTDNTFQPAGKKANANNGKDAVPTKDTTLIYDAPSFTPPEGHPRLYVTADQIEELKENANQPEMAPFLKNMRDNARWPVNSVQEGSYNPTVPVRLRGRAMCYILGEADEAHARQTIEYCKEYLETAVYPNVGDITRQIGEQMEATAIVYDWMYDLLTEEEKRFFIAKLLDLSHKKEIGYPPVGNNIYGHDCEQEIFRDMLAAGIAIYDEEPELFNLAAGMFDQMVPSRHLFNAAGNHPSGDSYGTWRLHCELMSEMILEPLGIPMENRIGQGVWNVPMRWIYSRKPTGGVFREGDTTTPKYYEYQMNRTPAMMAIIANLYPDAELNPLIYGEWLMNEGLSDWGTLPFYMLLIWDKDNPNKADLGQNMPLTYYSTYPLTQMYARTSWQKGLDAPTALAYMQGREKLTDVHDHPDLGSFQIFYKGTLANDSVGGSGGGWLTEMDKNWARRSISHNLVTVKDPDEVFFDNYYTYDKDWEVVANDGGQDFDKLLEQRFQETYEDLLANADMAETEGIYVGPNNLTPEFSYLQTDLTNAYAGKRVNKDTGKLLQEDWGFENKSGTIVPRTKIYESLGLAEPVSSDFRAKYDEKYKIVPKLSDNTRSMVFIDLFNNDYPAAFVVFDKVDSTNASFEKNWLLHMLEEPEVDGNTTIVRRTEQGQNGKMVVKTMLPENADIEIIGGEGKGTWVDGKNYGDPAPGQGEGGGWRIEVSPKTAAKEDVFLHAMYVTDNDRDLPELPMYKEEVGKFVGVTVMDRVVMFAKDARDIGTTFTMNVRDNNNGGVMSAMIADVMPGTWKVTGPDGKIQHIKVTEEQCALYFKGVPGSYTMETASDLSADEIEYPKTEKQVVGDYQVWSSDGLFRYQEKPVKLVDGVPYMPVDMLPYYNAEVIKNADGTWTVKSGTLKSAVLTPDSASAVVNGKAVTLSSKPFIMNDTLYINPIDIQSVFNCKITYDELALLMKVVILDDIEKLISATNTTFDKIVEPVEAVSSSDDGNVVAGMLDFNRETRWTGNGTDEWFTLDLGGVYDLDYLLMAFYSGNKRATIFEIEVSADGQNWTEVWRGQSSGTTDEFEKFELANANGVRHIRYKGHGNTVNTYNSITECIVVKK